ncbi:hypothetical protein CYY_003680 [Polysphondylium violaceum]|uniref:SDE2-like domain-containing protein n=1 Tax=Polysphondylium violaceum TaxID=133409 RepID=A0A8J4V0Y3_9MYCE|nr:hypothetical protein CYY_003680 [Polysphondylium violaceum]
MTTHNITIRLPQKFPHIDSRFISFENVLLDSLTEIKEKIHSLTNIPIDNQYLKPISSIDREQQVYYDLLLTVVGGKGGFGSLLRGNSKKVGQKKTTNFEACRDLSGRRLRHVNNERRIKDWQTDEEARKIAINALNKSNNKKDQDDADKEFDDSKYQAENEQVLNKVSQSIEKGLELLKNKSTTTTTTTTTTSTATATTTSTAALTSLSLYLPDFGDDDDDEDLDESEQEEEEKEKETKTTKVKKTK